jgi:hypothetical protein
MTSGLGLCLLGSLGVAILLMSLAGCSQKEEFAPDLVGGLKTDTLFVPVTVVPAFENSAGLGKNTGDAYNSRKLVVCNWRNYLSRGFLRFGELPDSTFDIAKATLFLYATRAEGATLSDSFGIYPLVDSLDQQNITWATMPAAGNRVAGFALEAPGEDSVTADITAMVSAWVKNEMPNRGISVRLDTEGTPQTMVEFASREDASTRSFGDTTIYVRPAIRIKYVDSAGDTGFVQALATEDTFADTLFVPMPDSLLAVANGSPRRAFIKFDVSSLPREANLVKASLRLSADMNASSFDSMVVVCHALLDTVSGFSTLYGTQGAGTTTLVAHKISTDPTFTMLVTPIVQPVVSGLVTNHGLIVRSSDEAADLDFVVFFPASAADTLAPRLEIIYTKPQGPLYRKDR